MISGKENGPLSKPLVDSTSRHMQADLWIDHFYSAHIPLPSNVSDDGDNQVAPQRHSHSDQLCHVGMETPWLPTAEDHLRHAT